MGAHIQFVTKAFIHLAGVTQMELWRRQSNPQECEKLDPHPNRKGVPNIEEGGKMGNRINANTKLQKTPCHSLNEFRKKKIITMKNEHAPEKK